MTGKPGFINIGPGRCGTSWLHKALEAHPEVSMSKVKETEFFNTNYDKGIEWYENHFNLNAGQKIAGEVSNNYYLDAQVPARIMNYNPDMKIIIHLRDSSGLLGSYYDYGLRRGLQFPPIELALDEPIGRFMGYDYRLARNALTPADQLSLLNSVKLYDLLLPFINTFPKEQIYFFIYEKFKYQLKEVLEEVYNFLGVDSSFLPESTDDVVNQGINPRFRILARAASRFAFFLRRIEAYRLLSLLHHSRVIKQVFFKPSKKNNREEWLKDLDDNVVSALNYQNKKMSNIASVYNQHLEVGN